MAVPRWLNAEEQRAWRTFYGAAQLLLDQLDRELQRDAGMPHTYYEILVVLSEAPDRALRMSELAVLTRTSRSRLSHAATKLEEYGWIRRVDCPTDRRGQIAELTDAGQAALVAAAPGHVAGVRSHLFDQLTDQQVEELREIGERLLRHLADHHPAAKGVIGRLRG
jgi:DNA-binding MarR family transcriptional regulator